MSIRYWLGAFTLASLSLAQAQTPYTVDAEKIAADNPTMLTQVKRVAITQFVVQFLDRQNNSAVSSGIRGGAAAKASLTLAGPGAAQYQRIADGLYEDAVQAVKAAGMDVVPHEQLAAHPEYAKLLDSGKASPQEDEKFVGYGGWTYSTRGLPITFDSDDEESFTTSSKDNDRRGDQYRSMGSVLGGNSTATRWAEWGLAKGLDAHLLKVRVTVPMAFIETSSGFMAGSASVKVTPAPRLARDVTRFAFRRERDSARVRLDQHLMLAPDMVTMETLSKKVDNSGGLGAVFGMLSSAQASAEYRLDAAPERYEAEVLAAARATFASFGKVLQQKRQAQ